MMAGVSDSLHGYNLFAYCFNNPVNLTDPSGNWPKWVEKAKKWINKKYEEWKEESFIYNVIIENVCFDLGIGFGVGGEIGVVFAVQAGVSISFSGTAKSFVSYAKKKGGYHESSLSVS